MEIFDISLPIKNEMVVWPGDPPVNLTQISEIIKGEEANISYLQFCVHTGTHIDAPKHYIDEGKTTNLIPLEKCIGEALVVHINPDVDVISEEVLINHPNNMDFTKTKRILFHTRNSNEWTAGSNKFNRSFVAINASGAKYLTELGVVLIGIDYLSVAPFDETLEPHQILLSNEVVLLEGLNLSNIEEGFYQLYCLPLKIIDCDGAPARAILTR